MYDSHLTLGSKACYELQSVLFVDEDAIHTSQSRDHFQMLGQSKHAVQTIPCSEEFRWGFLEHQTRSLLCRRPIYVHLIVNAMQIREMQIDYSAFQLQVDQQLLVLSCKLRKGDKTSSWWTLSSFISFFPQCHSLTACMWPCFETFCCTNMCQKLDPVCKGVRDPRS